ncbi:family 78 glycoside hydrolase catalytic domain [Streptomyces sp. NPDC126514]|uniref:family 78 glycoside hydrolase catalytic domain n=1 Tax=Streptomyces sp. NPDC126514 TaxID=3155210 RepID=UPI00332B8BC3
MPRRMGAVLVAVLAALLAGSLAPPAHPVAAAPPTAAAVDLSTARWIWYPEGNAQVSVPAGVRYFRKSFTVARGQVSEAQLVLTGDDTVDVWLNGKPLASSQRTQDSWRKAVYVDLGSAVTEGSNTLALAVRNSAAGPAGLLAQLRVVTPGGTTDLVSDGTWTSHNTAARGWEQPQFADGQWLPARESGTYGVAPWETGVAPPSLEDASPLTVAQATVDHRSKPLGVDVKRLRFGWKLSASAPQQRQGAYQIQVMRDADGEDGLWDSGRVASVRQDGISYDGPALESLTRYFWRVRVWDAQGRTGRWSGLQSFETALREATSQWQAGFIGQPVPEINFTGASWMWYPEGDAAASVPAGMRYFRRTLDLASLPANATLAITGDDTADIWVNGQLASASPRRPGSWTAASLVDITRYLRAGVNTFAVAAENSSQGPAGVLAKLELSGGGSLTSGTSWRTSRTAPTGWNNPGFDDAAWPQAQVSAAAGSGPWKALVGTTRTAPLLRKSITVDKPVASARLLTTALGLHETRLNGSRVGDDVLAPGWTDYNKRLPYSVYDVTQQLRQGENVLGATLGNGWYSGWIGFAGGQRYGTQPWYAAQLHVTYTDGTTQTVRTDDSWRITSGPIRADDLYQGESYDARLVAGAWDRPGYDDGKWSKVALRTAAAPRLVPRVDNGVTVQKELRPLSVTEPKPGVWVLDMGQNLTGWNRLSLRGPAGTTVTVRHGEVLNGDGTLYTANLRAAQATDRFVLAGTGETETFEPRFTVHGYRYVELTGLPSGFTPTAETVTARAAWTDGADSGTFTSSSAMLNKVQHAIVWGQRGNMLYVPTDCPQRDERYGWTGDIAAFAATSTFNLDVHSFLDKFSDDLVDAQRSDGAFTDVAPDVLGGAGTAGWGDAGVIVPYTLWQRYGDLSTADRHFTAMTRWVDYLRATAEPSLIRDRTTFGDWLNVADDTGQDVVSTAYFAWSARLVSRMATATGRTAEAASYGQLADRIAAAFTQRFVSSNGTVKGNTQTGYVLALSFGLLPPHLVKPAADRLAAKVASRNGHLSVGFLGAENLLHVLADNGHEDTAYQILMQPDYPGWGYMVNKGATTIWERWDSIRNDGSFQDAGMNSFNHYGLGSVGDFLYRQVAGLAPAEPGYGSLMIAPRRGGGLTSASATHETPYGRAVSEWSVANGTLTLNVSVPPGAWATVKVPTSQQQSVTAPAQAVPSGDNHYYLPSGTYTFTAAA